VKRWSANLLCGLSLLIFLLAMGIWVRSYYVTRYLAYQTAQGDSYAVLIARGVVLCTADPESPTPRQRWTYATSEPPTLIGWFGSRPDAYINIRFLGFQCFFWRGKEGLELNLYKVWLRLPLWLFLLFAIPPVLWVRRYRRQRGRGFPVQVVETTA